MQNFFFQISSYIVFDLSIAHKIEVNYYFGLNINLNHITCLVNFVNHGSRIFDTFVSVSIF